MLKREVIDQGKKFEQIAREMLPLIEKMEEVLLKHGVLDMAGVSIHAQDGYFTFDTHESGWDMTRIDSESPVKLRYNFSEEILPNDEESDSEPSLQERVTGNSKKGGTI